jgi:hypothetical protein
MYQGSVAPPQYKNTRHKFRFPKLSLVAIYERERARLKKEARKKARKQT